MRYPKFKVGDDVIIHNPGQPYDRAVGTITSCTCYDTTVGYSVDIHDWVGIYKHMAIDEGHLALLYYPAKAGEGETMNFIELHLRYGGTVYVNASNIASLRQITDDDGKELFTKVCLIDTEETYNVKETPDEIFEKMSKSMAVNVF